MEDYKSDITKALASVKKKKTSCEKKYGANFEHTKRLTKRIQIIEGELKDISDAEAQQAEEEAKEDEPEIPARASI